MPGWSGPVARKWPVYVTPSLQRGESSSESHGRVSFVVAFTRIFAMSHAYKPPDGEYERKKESGHWGSDWDWGWGWSGRGGSTQIKSKAAYTANARRNYSDGLISGLREAGYVNLAIDGVSSCVATLPIVAACEAPSVSMDPLCIEFGE